MTATEIGVVESIARYPVKSMRAEPLQSADIGWIGLHGDRQYAFVRADNRSRFPWLTGRAVSELVLYKAHYEDPKDPRNAAVRITAPDGAEYAIEDPALLDRLSRAAGEPVSLIQVGRGCFDQMPVSVVSTVTRDALTERRGIAVGLQRFRINFVIRANPGIGRESDWLGRKLQFGDSETGPRLNLGLGIARCAMVTIDPDTAERDPSMLRTVAQDFDNEIGAYGSVETQGVVSVGDRVRLVAASG